MASLIAKVVGKKLLGETLQNKFGTEDPYFEQVPATRLDGRPNGKVKKRRKALPPGISTHDGQILTKVKRRAHRLDLSLCSFFGIRFGLGSVIGLIPGIGDALDALLALMVFKTCCQIEGGLPAPLKMRMMLNIAFDFAVGLVPFVGDVADAAFKANSRNALLLEQHLREKGKKELRMSGRPMPAIDPSSPEEFDKIQRESPPGETSSNPLFVHEAMAAAESSPQARHERMAAYQGEVARDKPSYGWFGRHKSRPGDVEMGRSSDTHSRRGP